MRKSVDNCRIIVGGYEKGRESREIICIGDSNKDVIR